MLAKSWKRILLIVLIIACFINVINKIHKKVSFNKEMDETAAYFNEVKAKENAEKAKQPDNTVKPADLVNIIKDNYSSPQIDYNNLIN